METKSGDRQLNEYAKRPSNAHELDQQSSSSAAQSAAQIKREADIRSQFVTNLGKAFNFRLKAVELAAQFKSDDPMKLAREIYKFLSETEV